MYKLGTTYSGNGCLTNELGHPFLHCLVGFVWALLRFNRQPRSSVYAGTTLIRSDFLLKTDGIASDVIRQVDREAEQNARQAAGDQRTAGRSEQRPRPGKHGPFRRSGWPQRGRPDGGSPVGAEKEGLSIRDARILGTSEPKKTQRCREQILQQRRRGR